MAKRKRKGKRTKNQTGVAVATSSRSRVPTPRFKHGSIGTQLRFARHLLSPIDFARLEQLCTKRPLEIADTLDLGTIRNPISPEDAVTIEREALFAKARKAPHAKEAADPVGRAWLAGLLDGHGADPIALREAGREYARLYWMELHQLDAKAGNYEGFTTRSVGKRTTMAPTCNRDYRFNAFERALSRCDRKVRIALHSLTVDNCWFLEGPEWLDRAIARKPRPGDADMLRLATLGLLAMTVGMERAAA